MADGGTLFAAPEAAPEQDDIRSSLARAGLVFYPDSRPGITRRRCGRGFTFKAPDGTTIDDAAERRRLMSLAVPPVYEDVWICPKSNGHLQATGRDTRDRKQYRYHPDWTALRAETKYGSLAQFGRCLPRLRRRIDRGLSGEAGDQDFALAAVLALMDRLSLRVGHPEYARENDSYGATTLKRKHMRLQGGELRLNFTAKGGKKVRMTVRDRKLHRALGQVRYLPGRDLITWIDDEGGSHGVSSEMVNAALGAVCGEGHSAKTFRTWNGTLAAFRAAMTAEKLNVKLMAEAASQALHNTPTIARNSYIHPRVIALAEEEEPRALLARLSPEPLRGLRAQEDALIAFLES